MSEKDMVREARRILGEASRIHALKDNDPSKDEDVSWLIEALADEVERLREQLRIYRNDPTSADTEYGR